MTHTSLKQKKPLKKLLEDDPFLHHKIFYRSKKELFLKIG